MKHFITRLMTIAALIPCCAVVLAGTDTSKVVISELTDNTSTTNGQKRSTITEARAEMFGVTLEEWKHYETIMSGPRGLYTPNADPLFALGLEARNAEERRMFAERYLLEQRKRVEGELAFEAAVQAADKKLFPNESYFDAAKLWPQGEIHATTQETGGIQSADNLIIIVKKDCLECHSFIAQSINAVENVKDASIDIYVTDITDNSQINEWANSHKIPAHLNQRGVIRINNGVEYKDRLAENKSNIEIYMKRRGKLFHINVLEYTQR